MPIATTKTVHWKQLWGIKNSTIPT